MRNAGAGAVTEAEVMQGDRILGEKENLDPGPVRHLQPAADPGHLHRLLPERPHRAVDADGHGRRDPGARRHRRRRADPGGARLPQLRRGRVGRSCCPRTQDVRRRGQGRRRRRGQGAFAPCPRPLRDASSRWPSSFGDLDPEIDARVNDVAAGAQWTGFHRIEKALWQDGTTKGMTPYADKLVADVTRCDDPGPRPSTCRPRRSPTARSSCSARWPTARSPARRTATPTPTCATSRPTSPASEAAFDGS